jgi:hypothetical protein
MSKFVLETKEYWLIRCPAQNGHHTIPKVGRTGASWTFNGNYERPTFSPSVNDLVNPSDHKHFNPECPADQRCHFSVTDGRIKYHEDCTHSFKGQTVDMLPWDEDTVKYYDLLMKEES